MLDIYFGDHGLKDFVKDRHSVGQHITALMATVQAIEGLYLHQYPNIKRLSGVKPTVWRYRSGDFRVIFTIGSKTGEPFLIIHRVGKRSDIYDRLPRYFPTELTTESLNIEEFEDAFIDDKTDRDIEEDSEFQDFERYYKLPKTILNKASDNLVEYIVSGNYLFNPCLTSEQKKLTYDIIKRDLNIYRIQGSAGTGKTTIAFHLANIAVEHDIFPLIIVPNPQLKKFGKQSLKTINSHTIREKFDGEEVSDIALFTREEFLQQLAGDTDPVLSMSRGCQIIKEKIHYFRNQLNNQYKNINIYAIVQAVIVTEDNYKANARDALRENYSDLIEVLEKHWPRDKSIFDGKDSISQAKRAIENIDNYIAWLEKIAGDRSVMLIIDEVQDFYWLQLKALLELGKKSSKITSVILLGDENQRVTFSGFSWDSFASTFGDSKLYPVQTMQKNFRNTKQIAATARYILRDAFEIKNDSKTRHLPDPGDPSYCYEEGKKPSLIKVDKLWLEEMFNYLEEIEKEEFSTIVLIHRDLLENSDWQWVIQKIKELSEKIYCCTISEAKGQEFQATVILLPFETKQQDLAIDDLFDWYTAMTRSRYYQSILVSAEELNWLRGKVKDKHQLTEYFTIQENLNVQDFVTELNREGKSFITLQQMRDNFIKSLVKEVQEWLQNDKIPIDLAKRWHDLKFSWWELIEELSDALNNSDILLENDLKLQPLDSFQPLEALILYSSAKILLNDYSKMTEQLVLKLEQYTKIQPKTLLEGLEKVKDIELKVVILRGSYYSWEAAKLVIKHPRLKDGINNIISDLQRRGLEYEAIRMRVKLLKESPPSNHHFSDVFEQNDSLVTNLCKSFIAGIKYEL